MRCNGFDLAGRILRTELKEIYFFTKRNYNEIVVVSFAVLFLTLNEYHLVWNQWFSSLLYYAVLPILVIVVLLRKNPLDFGLRLGNPRIWSFYVIITCLVGIPILFVASRSSSLQSYYTIEHFNPFIYFLETAVYLFAWEFMFRGFLLFGLKEKLREASILLQMVPFVLLHFGKPEIETISTILTGVYFGYIVYRGNCYWPAFIIHLFINITLVFFVNLLW
jgi:membrane protease YdiL (CAAX protease family)